MTKMVAVEVERTLVGLRPTGWNTFPLDRDDGTDQLCLTSRARVWLEIDR
jgi:hypothetical protein